MNISEIRFIDSGDASTLREFSYKIMVVNLVKNQTSYSRPSSTYSWSSAPTPQAPVAPVAAPAAVETPATPVEEASAPTQAAEGEVVESTCWCGLLVSITPQPFCFCWWYC